jgi:hypothetical protein
MFGIATRIEGNRNVGYGEQKRRMVSDVRCARQTQNSRQPQLAFQRTVASPLIRIYLLPRHRQGRLGLCQSARSDLETHLLWRKSARPTSV